MRHLADALSHALPDLLRCLAEDKLAGIAVQVLVAWASGGG